MKKVGKIAIRGVLGLIILLAVLVAVSFLSNLRLDGDPDTADRLTAGEKARMAEALNLRAERSSEIWEGWSEANLPTILYNEAFAFLIAGGEAPAGWEKVPGDTFAGASYYRRSLEEMEPTPQAFAYRLDDRWTGSMATLEQTRAVLIGEVRDDLPGFLKPIFPYRLVLGLYVSDWHIAALNHESFHAYQATVAPAKFKLAEMGVREAQERYPWEEEEFASDWNEELDLLIDGVTAKNDATAAGHARRFLEVRDKRRVGLSPSLISFERRREWLEGLAKYTELELWRAGSTDDYEPTAEIMEVKNFKGYETFESRWRNEMNQARGTYDDVGDGRFYYSGMAQAYLLDRLAPGWRAEVMEEQVWLEDLLREAIAE